MNCPYCGEPLLPRLKAAHNCEPSRKALLVERAPNSDVVLRRIGRRKPILRMTEEDAQRVCWALRRVVEGRRPFATAGTLQPTQPVTSDLLIFVEGVGTIKKGGRR